MLADTISMSPSRFAARFRQTTGQSVMSYVANWRMNVACRLLRETEGGLADIAQRVGYQDVAAFSRAFTTLRATSGVGFREGRHSSQALTGECSTRDLPRFLLQTDGISGLVVKAVQCVFDFSSGEFQICLARACGHLNRRRPEDRTSAKRQDNVGSVPIAQLDASVRQGGKTVNRCSGYLRQLGGADSSDACSFRNVSRHEDRAILL